MVLITASEQHKILKSTIWPQAVFQVTFFKKKKTPTSTDTYLVWFLDISSIAKFF